MPLVERQPALMCAVGPGTTESREKAQPWRRRAAHHDGNENEMHEAQLKRETIREHNIGQTSGAIPAEDLEATRTQTITSKGTRSPSGNSMSDCDTQRESEKERDSESAGPLSYGFSAKSADPVSIVENE